MSVMAFSETTTERPQDASGRTRIFDVGDVPRSTFSTVPNSSGTADPHVRKSVEVAPEDPLRLAASVSYAPIGLGEGYFKVIKNWQGAVEYVDNDKIVAIVRNAQDPSDPGDEQFEFDVEDVEEGDRELVTKGAIFYLTVGYRIHRGSRLKCTRVVFRRMPRWSKNDIARVNERADRLLDILQKAEQGDRRS